MPQLASETLSARELSLDDWQKLPEFASVYGRAVRQRSVRQAQKQLWRKQERHHPLVQMVMLRCDNIHNDSVTRLQSAQPNSEESGGGNQEEGEEIEFDSDENIEVDK